MDDTHSAEEGSDTLLEDVHPADDHGNELTDDEEEDLMNCSVCFEHYVENGDHVPRMLPCSDTFCEKCIRQLIRKNLLTCPVCVRKHTPVDDVKKFPQNKYILSHMRHKQKAQKNLSVSKKAAKECTAHNQQLCFYCKETSCQREICSRCFLNAHRYHEVVDLEEGHKQLREKLLSEIETLITDIEHNQQELVKAKDQINENYLTCVTSAKKRRNDYIKIIQEAFSKLSQDAFDQMKNTKRSVDVDLAEIEQHLVDLGSMKENMNEATCEEITCRIERLQAMKAQTESRREGTTYRCPEYNDSNTTVNEIVKLCGYLTQKDILFDKSFSNPAKIDRPRRSKLKVTRMISTNYSKVGSACLLAKGHFVLCGEERSQWKLTLYDFTKREVSQTILHEEDSSEMHLANVIFNRTDSLVISYRSKQMLEFRDTDDLDDIIGYFSTEPGLPGCMCACLTSNSTLIFQAASKFPGLTKWLDCSGPTPHFSQTTHTRGFATSMCCLRNKSEEEILVTTYKKDNGMDGRNEGGISAFNASTDKHLWDFSSAIPGMEYPMFPTDVTTDGYGRLLVCDANNHCLQMFLADGRYLAPYELEFPKVKDEDVGIPCYIRWASDISSFVGVIQSDKKYLIAVISVEDQY